MKRIGWTAVAALALATGCGVPKDQLEAKSKEAADAKAQVAKLQQQVSDDEAQIGQLKSSLGMAQSQAITDDQKSELEEAKRAMQEAQERGKVLADLQAKLKKAVDAGHLKITTRHGRVVLQLHNDVLFDKGEADVKPDGKTALAEIAATLKSFGAKRFQVAGHTDTEPVTAATKKQFPTNWELSTARAIAVVKILVANGVEPSMLSAAGYGPYDPVAPNGSADGQAKNRRIEITVVPNVAGLLTAAATPAPPAPAAAAAPAASAH